MSERKHNEPFRMQGVTLGEQMRSYAGDCSCDEPTEGESGIIVCTNCALLSFADEADALVAVAKMVECAADAPMASGKRDGFTRPTDKQWREIVMKSSTALAKTRGDVATETVRTAAENLGDLTGTKFGEQLARHAAKKARRK